MTMILERNQAVKSETRLGTRRGLDISIADLEASLEGLHYPAGRQELLDRVSANRASEDVVAFLRLLPNGRYHHFHDIAFMAWSFLLV